MKKLILSFSFILGSSLMLWAGGYQVRLQGNKNTGMGLTGVGLNLGSSSVFFNPGALSMMQTKADFSLGASMIFSGVAFEKSGTNYHAETESKPGTPFYAYGAGYTVYFERSPIRNSFRWAKYGDSKSLLSAFFQLTSMPGLI